MDRIATFFYRFVCSEMSTVCCLPVAFILHIVYGFLLGPEHILDF